MEILYQSFRIFIQLSFLTKTVQNKSVNVFWKNYSCLHWHWAYLLSEFDPRIQNTAFVLYKNMKMENEIKKEKVNKRS